MDKLFGISVIIPVFNAATFVEKAVMSVLQQQEVKEIILIEDGSTDNSLEICEELNKLYPQVKLFRHPNGVNKGAGASRNLGLNKTNFSFVAFLDADDYYLSDRFKGILKLFEKYPLADGFYGKATYQFYSDIDKEKYQKIYGSKADIGLSKEVPPEKLFDVFMADPGEWFRLDSITIRSTFLKKIGYFDEFLKQTQDTDFLLRCCFYGRLYSTIEKEPRTCIGIHGSNRVLNQEEANFYRYHLLKKWLKTSLFLKFSNQVNRYLLRSFLDCHPLVIEKREFVASRILSKLFVIVVISFNHPKWAAKFLLRTI